MSDRRGRGWGRPWLVAVAATVGAAAALFVLVPTATATATATATGMAPAPGRRDQAQDPALVGEGRDLYLLQCASCHGADAKGTERGPTLVR
jgi:mono/diheme cytochrome c family protein